MASFHHELTIDPARRRRQTKEATMATTRPTTYTTLVDWLTNRVAANLGTTPAAIATDESFADYGLDSVFALDLCTRLEDEFGILAQPTIAWDYPTIDAIARHLAEVPRATP